MPNVDTTWEPSAEWTVEFIDLQRYEKVVISDIQAPSEAVALLFALRAATGAGYEIDASRLKHLKTERIN